MAVIRRNYMLSPPGEGFCNPYRNVDQSSNWPASFDGVRAVASDAPAARSIPVVRPSKSRISLIARQALRQAWRRREAESRNGQAPDSFDVVDPMQVLKDLGYGVDSLNSLGQFTDIDGSFEVAGQIDPATKSVFISRQFPPEVMRFTAAHELGHALLHRGMSLHRDRPADGSLPVYRKRAEEVDADYFAACFLMPERLVKDEFLARFLTEKFVLNGDVAFALGYSDVATIRQTCGSYKGLAQLLAGTMLFNGMQFLSLAERFRVSVKSMAIRLWELGLVTPRSL